MLMSLIVAAVGLSIVANVKELPKYSRLLGRFTGRGLKFLQEAKQTLLQTSDKNSELFKLQRELTESIAEIHGIRNELRQGVQVRPNQVIMNELDPQWEIQQQLNSQPRQNQEMYNQLGVEKNSSSPLSSSLSSQIDTSPLEEKPTSSSSSITSHQKSTAGIGKNPSKRSSMNFGSAFAVMLHDQNNATISESSSSSSSSSSNMNDTATANSEQNIGKEIQQQEQHHQQKPSNFQTSHQQESITSNASGSSYHMSIREYNELYKKPTSYKKSPFSEANFGIHLYRHELTDDSSIPTERVGSGADFVGIDILEKNFSNIVMNKDRSDLPEEVRRVTEMMNQTKDQSKYPKN